MKVLILGVSGLIGHKLLQVLSRSHETYGTLHNSKESYGNIELFSSETIIQSIDIRNFDILEGIMYAIDPDVIINCVGITKRKKEIIDPIYSLEVNSIFPHRLANWAKIFDKRVIHFSTDCVFNGKEGGYTDNSVTNAEDLYGKSKAFGEINYSHTLTIRSSFIGHELFGKSELLEWFLAIGNKKTKGFQKAYYSGVSTLFMARTVQRIITEYPKLAGLYNLATDIPISKYDLLLLAKVAFETSTEIVPDDNFVLDRTLDSKKIRNEIGLVVPSWEEMMLELSEEKNYINRQF